MALRGGPGALLQATLDGHPAALGQVPAGVLGLLAPDDHVHEVGVGALLALPLHAADGDPQRGDVGAVAGGVELRVGGQPAGDGDDVEVHGALLGLGCGCESRRHGRARWRARGRGNVVAGPNRAPAKPAPCRPERWRSPGRRHLICLRRSRSTGRRPGVPLPASATMQPCGSPPAPRARAGGPGHLASRKAGCGRVPLPTAGPGAPAEAMLVGKTGGGETSHRWDRPPVHGS